jgi:hypothetical protein
MAQPRRKRREPGRTSVALGSFELDDGTTVVLSAAARQTYERKTAAVRTRQALESTSGLLNAMQGARRALRSAISAVKRDDTAAIQRKHLRYALKMIAALPRPDFGKMAMAGSPYLSTWREQEADWADMQRLAECGSRRTPKRPAAPASPNTWPDPEVIDHTRHERWVRSVTGRLTRAFDEFVDVRLRWDGVTRDLLSRGDEGGDTRWLASTRALMDAIQLVYGPLAPRARKGGPTPQPDLDLAILAGKRDGVPSNVMRKRLGLGKAATDETLRQRARRETKRQSRLEPGRKS